MRLIVLALCTASSRACVIHVPAVRAGERSGIANYPHVTALFALTPLLAIDEN